MPTYYLRNTVITTAKYDELDPSAYYYDASYASWVCAKKVSLASPFKPDTAQPATTFVAEPTAFSTLGYRTSATLNQIFNAGNWVLSFAVHANTYFAQKGYVKFRLWRSTNADGSGATQITDGWKASSLIGFTAGGVNVTGSATWDAIGIVTLTDEYLFVEVEWYATVSGGNNGAVVYWHHDGPLDTLVTPAPCILVSIADSVGLADVVTDVIISSKFLPHVFENLSLADVVVVNKSLILVSENLSLADAANFMLSTGWGYFKSHVIGYAAGAGTNYPKRVTVHYGGGTDGSPNVSGEDVYCDSRCKADFGDVRFTGGDGSSLLDYWVESKVDGDYAVFWVEVTGSLESVNQTIYIYYGKTDATTVSNGKNTFPFFDDFSVSPNGWTFAHGGSISGGNLVIPASSAAAVQVTAYKTRPAGLDNYRFRLGLANCAATNNGWFASGRGFLADGNGALPVFLARDYYYNPLTQCCFITRAAVLLSNLAPARDNLPHLMEYTKFGIGVVYRWDDASNTGTDPATETGTLVTFGYWGSLNSVANINWVFLAKYVSPEPAHGSWGSAQVGVKTVADSLVLSEALLKNCYLRWGFLISFRLVEVE